MWNIRSGFRWDLVLIFIPVVISRHSIFVVVTGNFYIVTGVFNVNSIEICNNTKVGKGFIRFARELNSVPYFFLISSAKDSLKDSSADSSTCLRR